MTIILFGVTGCGKTTIAELLAEKIGWKVYDADDFHPPENIEKMRNGNPLNDVDRKGWLKSLRDLIDESADTKENNTLACSALKVSYRSYLNENNDVKFVFLEADRETIEKRLNNRKGHFMNPKLLESQFETLEISDEIDLILNATLPAEEIVAKIAEKFNL
jgi:gluconokinase